MSDLYELRQIAGFGIVNAKRQPDGRQVVILTFDEPGTASTANDPIRWVMSMPMVAGLIEQLKAAAFDAEVFELNGGEQ